MTKAKGFTVGFPTDQPVTYPKPWHVGDRVKANRTGWTGTVIATPKGGVRVKWDRSGADGVVVRAAYDLTPTP